MELQNITITYGKGFGENTRNIFVNGEYWGQEFDKPYGPTANMLYIVFSPESLRNVEEILDRTVGFWITPSDSESTIKQMYILSKGIHAPF